jgi:hypothetical protein
MRVKLGPDGYTPTHENGLEVLVGSEKTFEHLGIETVVPRIVVTGVVTTH